MNTTPDHPYDQAEDGVLVSERPNVYQSVSDDVRRGLWNSQSRAILDKAIELVHAGDSEGAVKVIEAFVTRFNARYGAHHKSSELRLP